MILQVTTILPLPPPEPARDKLYLFHDRTFPVSLQEFFQIEDILLDLLAGIGIGHQFSAGKFSTTTESEKISDSLMIAASVDSKGSWATRRIPLELHTSVYPQFRLFLICFGKATVDDQQLTAAFDG